MALILAACAHEAPAKKRLSETGDPMTVVYDPTLDAADALSLSNPKQKVDIGVFWLEQADLEAGKLMLRIALQSESSSVEELTIDEDAQGVVHADATITEIYDTGYPDNRVYHVPGVMRLSKQHLGGREPLIVDYELEPCAIMKHKVLVFPR
jgi:hypothetical protein